jgi:hypothetical protein
MAAAAGPAIAARFVPAVQVAGADHDSAESSVPGPSWQPPPGLSSPRFVPAVPAAGADHDSAESPSPGPSWLPPGACGRRALPCQLCRYRSRFRGVAGPETVMAAAAGPAISARSVPAMPAAEADHDSAESPGPRQSWLPPPVWRSVRAVPAAGANHDSAESPWPGTTMAAAAGPAIAAHSVPAMPAAGADHDSAESSGPPPMSQRSCGDCHGCRGQAGDRCALRTSRASCRS